MKLKLLFIAILALLVVGCMESVDSTMANILGQ